MNKKAGMIKKSLYWMAEEVKKDNMEYVAKVLALFLVTFVVLSFTALFAIRHIWQTFFPVPIIKTVEVASHSELKMLSDTLDHLREEHAKALKSSRDASNKEIREQQTVIAKEIQEQIDGIITTLYNRFDSILLAELGIEIDDID